jgi:hypothetical protein
MRNSKIFLKVVCFLILILFQTNLNAQGNKVKYYVKGSFITYYALLPDSASHISVTGPGTLTITTRARFKSDSPDSLSYSILYQSDNKIKIFTAKKVLRAGSDVYIKSIDDVPSTSKTFTIKVDPDVHDYSFLMLKESPQVDLHYKFVPDSVVEWKDVSSLNDTAEIKVKVDNSNAQSYYRFSLKSPQKFKITGPTSLRILTRLEYDYTMQGLVSYRVCVKRNDTIIGTYKLSGSPSVEAQYVNNKKLVPGTLEKIFLDVPAGDNYYEFTLLDKQFTSLVRVSKKKKTEIK